MLTAKRRSQLITAKLPRVEKIQRRLKESFSAVGSFGHSFLRITNTMLSIADKIPQIMSVVERLHRRSNEGR